MSNEKKYTPEEIKAIVEEELRKANLHPGNELSVDALEGVSGGGVIPKETYRVPKTHEEIDAKWDIVQSVLDKYGVDVAYITAMQLQIIAGSSNLLTLYGPQKLRKRMHNSLDGKTGGMERFTQH